MLRETLAPAGWWALSGSGVRWKHGVGPTFLSHGTEYNPHVSHGLVPCGHQSSGCREVARSKPRRPVSLTDQSEHQGSVCTGY